MDLDGNFQDKLYAGKVYFINSKNGEIVASGEGTFDTENLKLLPSISILFLNRLTVLGLL